VAVVTFIFFNLYISILGRAMKIEQVTPQISTAPR